MDRFQDFAIKALFAILVGLGSLISKILLDIEDNMGKLRTDVSILTSNSIRHERDIDKVSTYSLVLQRFESELSFQKQQIEALQNKKR
jgi:hypothetical protein